MAKDTSKATAARVAVSTVKGAVNDAPAGSQVTVRVIPPFLTPSEKREKVAEMLREGASYTDIQDALLVSPTTVSQVKKRMIAGLPVHAEPNPVVSPVIATVPAVTTAALPAAPCMDIDTAMVELRYVIAKIRELEARKTELLRVIA